MQGFVVSITSIGTKLTNMDNLKGPYTERTVPPYIKLNFLPYKHSKVLYDSPYTIPKTS
jgi:hypothetical protein